MTDRSWQLFREARDIQAGRITPKACNGTHLMVYDSLTCVRCGWYPKLRPPQAALDEPEAADD